VSSRGFPHPEGPKAIPQECGGGLTQHAHDAGDDVAEVSVFLLLAEAQDYKREVRLLADLRADGRITADQANTEALKLWERWFRG
jgi:hypothetical protein